MDREQLSEFSRQEYFILRLRECADKLATFSMREDVLTEAAHLFAEFAGASDALIIDLSRESLDIYRSAEACGADGAEPDGSTTVILEESVGPLLELLRDRYMCELGIRVFNQRIVNPPDGISDIAITEALEELGMTQGFILPLTVMRSYGTENVHGILLINNVPSYRFADPAHLALVRIAADLLSITADNVDLGNALSRLRPTDQVTGLASRTRLLAQLAQEVPRATFFERSFALILADIDNFKSVNDRKGYLYGDLVIKTVADDIMAESRKIDIVSRWGGEEYLVLMPEASAQQAFEFAERCRKRVGEHPITPDDFREEIFVSLSFGVVVYPDHGRNSDILLRNAELALLQSKLNGRNQSVLWSTDWQSADK